jgi:tetratricopeptide (TPR) repeat protein
MNFWDILEIDPTDNISIVKKAYAKKLKLHHPEDDPEGYQKLREAYDSALKYLKNNKNKQTIISSNKKINEVPEIIFKEDDLINDKQVLPNFNILEEHNEKPLGFEEIVEEFIDKAKALYDDFLSRINLENWITLLNSEAMWYMGDKKLLSNKMIEFLIENHYFPGNIWKIFENNFNWLEEIDYLYDKYDVSFINYLVKQINDNNGLRYCYFKEGQVFDYDTFLRYREEAFEALLNDDFEYAEECINISYNIYAEDPDLLLMKGKCYVHKGELDKALQIFEYVIQKNSEDIFARFFRAKVLYDIGQIGTALEDCKYLEAQSFDNVDFLLLFAKCYFKLEKFQEAKELLLKLSEFDSCNIEVKDLLRKINLQLSYKLKEELKKIKGMKK